MRALAQAIKVIDGEKFILCTAENGSVRFAEPLPEGELGKDIEELMNVEGARVNLVFDHTFYDSPKKIVSYSAVL